MDADDGFSLSLFLPCDSPNQSPLSCTPSLLKSPTTRKSYSKNLIYSAPQRTGIHSRNRCPLSPPSPSSLTAKVTSSVDLLRSLPSRLVFLRIFPENIKESSLGGTSLHSMGRVVCRVVVVTKVERKFFENLCKTVPGETAR